MAYPKATDIIAYARSKLSCGYLNGALGEICTEAFLQKLAARLPARYTPDYLRRSRKWMGAQCFDCIGLIKYFAPWKQDVGKNYKANEDINADGALTLAKVKGPIGTMPDMPGLCVHMPGHIGIYIGGGEVIEARGVDYGVVKTKLAGRGWVNWLQFPFLDYSDTPATYSPTPTPKMPVLKQGAKSEVVKTLQTALNKYGTLPLLAVDGSFGPATDKAVRAFQKAKGLAVDGSCGPKTWAALGY